MKAIQQGTYQQCLTKIGNIFKSIDLNNDGYIDRCEDAKFLMSVNNGNKSYAMNYAGDGTLSYIQGYCDYWVLDAFD